MKTDNTKRVQKSAKTVDKHKHSGTQLRHMLSQEQLNQLYGLKRRLKRGRGGGMMGKHNNKPRKETNHGTSKRN